MDSKDRNPGLICAVALSIRPWRLYLKHRLYCTDCENLLMDPPFHKSGKSKSEEWLTLLTKVWVYGDIYDYGPLPNVFQKTRKSDCLICVCILTHQNSIYNVIGATEEDLKRNNEWKQNTPITFVRVSEWLYKLLKSMIKEDFGLCTRLHLA